MLLKRFAFRNVDLLIKTSFSEAFSDLLSILDVQIQYLNCFMTLELVLFTLFRHLDSQLDTRYFNFIYSDANK